MALEQGYSYAAVTKTQEHCAWLQQHLDRQILRYVASSGSQLHNKHLQPAITAHFVLVVEQLEVQDIAENEEDEADLEDKED